MPKSRKRKRKSFLKPYRLPPEMQAGDLVAVDKDGNVFPLTPEIIGTDWESIRKFLAPLDRSKIPTLEDLRRDRDEDN